MTWSLAVTPGARLKPVGFEVVVMDGVRQVANGAGPAKSVSEALNDWAVLVCGRKVWKQPLNARTVRSMPPSRKSFAAIVVVAPPVSRQTHPPQATALPLVVKFVEPGMAICW